MIREEIRNVSIIVGGSIGLLLVLIGGFFMLCVLSWALMLAMDWLLVLLGFPRAFGSDDAGPSGLEILIGAFLLLSLRRLARIARPED